MVRLAKPEDWESPEYKAHIAEIVAKAPPLPRRVIELLRAARADRVARDETGVSA